jgi:hypothetical protein
VEGSSRGRGDVGWWRLGGGVEGAQTENESAKVRGGAWLDMWCLVGAVVRPGARQGNFSFFDSIISLLGLIYLCHIKYLHTIHCIWHVNDIITRRVVRINASSSHLKVVVKMLDPSNGALPSSTDSIVQTASCEADAGYRKVCTKLCVCSRMCVRLYLCTLATLM